MISAQDFYLGTIIGGTLGLLALTLLVWVVVFDIRKRLDEMSRRLRTVETISIMYRESTRVEAIESAPGADVVPADADQTPEQREIAQLKQRVKQLSGDNTRLSYGIAALFAEHPAPATYSEPAAAAHTTAVAELQRAVASVIEPPKK